MSTSERTRLKGLKKSQELLGVGTTARSYGTGLIGPNPRRTRWLVFIGAAGLGVFLSHLIEVLIIPVVLIMLALVIYYAIDKPASVVITDHGVVILARSEVTGMPRRVLTVIPQGRLADAAIERSGNYVHIPARRLWIHLYDYLLLTSNETASSGSLSPEVTAAIKEAESHRWQSDVRVDQQEDKRGIAIRLQRPTNADTWDFVGRTAWCELTRAASTFRSIESTFDLADAGFVVVFPRDFTPEGSIDRGDYSVTWYSEVLLEPRKYRFRVDVFGRVVV